VYRVLEERSRRDCSGSAGPPEVRAGGTAQPEDTEWDGVAELYFDSPEAMQEAFESEAGQRMLEDGPNFTKEEPQINILCEENVLYEE